MEGFETKKNINIKSVKEALKSLGLEDKLAFFNDLIWERRAPHPDSGYHLVFENVLLPKIGLCDIYHTDQDEDGNLIEDHTFHRVFLHLKENQ